MQDALPPLPPLGHQEKHPGVVADGEEKKKGGGVLIPDAVAPHEEGKSKSIFM